jgi:hypothetical protein
MQYYGSSDWQSDPTLTVDRLGNFYMSVLDFVDGSSNESAIVFYNSFNKGVSWNGPFGFATGLPGVFEDKQFITVDRTGGTYDGRLYCSWTRFEDDVRIMLIGSNDGGMTFSDTVVIAGSQSSTGCGSTQVSAGQFSIPVVNKNGNIHVLWIGLDLDSGGTCGIHTAIKHSRSTNGGATFTQLDTLLRVSGYMSSNGGANTYSNPAADADITSGPYAGNLYVAFANRGAEDVSGTSDIDFVRSTDDGLTWSNRITINDDANPFVHNFHPWLIVNEEGVIIVVFYDERLDSPSFTSMDLWAAYSFDGGLTFTTNHRISSASSPLPAKRSAANILPYETNPDGTNSPLRLSPLSPANPEAGMIGEYIGVTAYRDKMVAVWTDTRHGNQEAYSARWYLPLLEPRLQSPDSGSIVTSSPTLSWATSWKENDDRYLVELSMDSTFTTGVNSAIRLSNRAYTTAIEGWTSFPEPLIFDGKYFWQVKVYKVSTSDSSAWSPTWSFVLDAPVDNLPALYSPANGYTSTIATPTFAWEPLTSVGTLNHWLEISTNSDFVGGDTRFYDADWDTMLVLPQPLLPDSVYYWRVRTVNLWDGGISKTNSRTITYQPIYICGDVNNSGTNPNVADIVYLVRWLFQGGPPPPITASANVNGVGAVNVSDVTYFVRYLFASGPPLNCQ